MGSTKAREVRRTFFLRASAKEAFRAISTPEGLERWMVERAELPLRKGAQYTLVFQGGWTHQGKVLDVRPGKKLVLAWAWKGVPLKGTILTLSVTPKRGGSLLTFVHAGFPKTEAWVDLYGVTEWGWTYYGMNLKSVLETGRDLRSEFDG